MAQRTNQTFFLDEQGRHQDIDNPTEHEQHLARGHNSRGSFSGSIPDLRFEYSYLRSIQPFVKIQRVNNAVASTESESSDGEDDESYEKVNLTQKEVGRENGETSPPLASQSSEIIQVEWANVLWTTAKDQVLSPFIQGALWALASYYISPLSSELGAKMGLLARSKLPSREGTGISWLRRFSGAFGISTKQDNKLS
ncbi:hypothetical protein FA15DRAFT_615503 [Coprinopsis marcescibilis]|uniref:Uncharacterized protein n=1 Tax=Coprinopsis marcescibilis TaxID=230819 RepID=A0A5C3L1A9_COPMA|nr:hypothetical protein FA15DRAFT_615503 [Coprinopsis marcescibilis]